MSLQLPESLGLAGHGQDIVIRDMAKLAQTDRITLGDAIFIDDFSLIIGGTKTTLGSFVHVASFVSLLGSGEIEIEDFAQLSSGVRIYSGTDDFHGGSLAGPGVPPEFRTAVVRAQTRVGRHCIVGANSVVLPGVTIGEGAVVGALSLVTVDVAPWTINVGSPARPIKQRPRETILRMEAELHTQCYDEDGSYIPRDRR